MYQRIDRKAGDYIFTEKRYIGRHPEGPRRKKEKPTEEAVRRYNSRQRTDRVQMLIAANFRPGDLWTTLTYRKEDRPKDAEEAGIHMQRFIRKLRREIRKAGRELKYIYITEIGARGAAHHHILLENIPGILDLIRKLWPYGHENYKPLYEDGAYRQLAEYIAKADTKEPAAGTSYHPSRNLKKPVEHREKLHSKHWSREPKPRMGYDIIKDSIINGENPITGRPYQRYIQKRRVANDHKIRGSGNPAGM